MISLKRDNPDRMLGLVHAVSGHGHRSNYLTLFENAVGLTPTTGRIGFRLASRLILAPRVCFATLDDHLPTCMIISIIRAVLNRPTLAIFLRPHSCFDITKYKSLLKRLLLYNLRQLPKVTIITILPFEVDERDRIVATCALHDPELWDLVDKSVLRQREASPLSCKIKERARGRPVVAMLGSLNRIKGFGILTELLWCDPRVTDKYFIVAAGCLSSDCAQLAAEFERGGGFLVNRRLTDEELLSLYGIADIIWACYQPEYDQASGIFGRAVQFGVTPAVRMQSRIHRFANLAGIKTVALQGKNPKEDAYALLMAAAQCKMDIPTDRIEILTSWRDQFWQTVINALSLTYHKNEKLQKREL